MKKGLFVFLPVFFGLLAFGVLFLGSVQFQRQVLSVAPVQMRQAYFNHVFEFGNGYFQHAVSKGNALDVLYKELLDGNSNFIQDYSVVIPLIDNGLAVKYSDMNYQEGINNIGRLILILLMDKEIMLQARNAYDGDWETMEFLCRKFRQLPELDNPKLHVANDYWHEVTNMDDRFSYLNNCLTE